MTMVLSVSGLPLFLFISLHVKLQPNYIHNYYNRAFSNAPVSMFITASRQPQQLKGCLTFMSATKTLNRNTQGLKLYFNPK